MPETVAGTIREAMNEGCECIGENDSTGVFCVGCYWALMLVTFALGVASLIWMALLTALMVHEETRPAGARTVPLTGITLLRSVRPCFCGERRALLSPEML
jgi:predicted metal-binding membrane protein